MIRIVVTSLCALILNAGFVVAQPAGLPVELELVPDKALVVISGRVSDLWKSEGAVGLRKMAKDEPDLDRQIGQMEAGVGFALTDIDRAVLAGWGSLQAPQFVFFISSTKALDQGKLRAALTPEAEEKKIQGKSVFVGNNGKAVYFVNEKLFAGGAAGDIEELLSPRQTKERPLADALKLGNRHLVVGAQVGAVAKSIEGATPPPLQPALQAQTATLSAAVARKQLSLDLQLRFANGEAAEAGEKAVHAALAIAKQSLPMIIDQVTNQKAEGREKELRTQMAQFLKDTQTALANPTVQRQGTTVNTSLQIETADPALALILMLPRAKKN